MAKKHIIGYESMDGRIFVAAEDALDHVLIKCGVKIVDKVAPDAEEFRDMVVEWYFSGNWVEVYG